MFSRFCLIMSVIAYVNAEILLIHEGSSNLALALACLFFLGLAIYAKIPGSA